MPKNNFISQFFIPHFAFLTNFAFKNRPVWNNTLTSSTWSPNESYNAVDQVIRATHRRPHILCSDEFNLRQWNLLHDRVCGVESVVLLGVYPRYRATPEQGPTQKPSKDETLCAEGHQPTTCKLCLNIEQWKTTSCLPSKQCVGWFLDFVITSWSEFLKFFTFKALGHPIWHTYQFSKGIPISGGRIRWQKVPSNCTTQSRCMIHNKPPFIITPLATTFFVTLTNCDLNVYNHIPYKHFQGCDCR